MRIRYYFIFFLLTLTTPLFLLSAQTATGKPDPIRCGLEQWLELQMQNPDFAEEFRQTEAYLKTKGLERNPSCSNPIILPVAIHWNGNVDDVPCLVDMAENQIQVLNEDFGGYNEDILNYCEHSMNCPDDYPNESISGGTCIQFCLATMNHPAGSGLSNGDPAFTFGQYTFNSGASAWSGYVNLFVSDVPPSGYGSNLLGLAPLGGGANPNGNGVWINANAFGGYEEECDAGSVTINSNNQYDLGRTTTHELGHYFGLRHIFAGCGNGDYIADTPPQSEENYGVPTIGPDCVSTANNTCGTQDFFFNYMDYTNDEAMYMFTSGQSDVLYDVATDGNYQTAATRCGTLPDSYDPLYPNGCFSCPDLIVDATVADVSCNGDCNGSITIDQVIEGTGPFSYEWGNGEDTETIEDLCPGDYEITITDNLGCEVIESFTVYEPDELFDNTTSTDETGNDFEDGTATADPTGGIEPYYYEWSNGETTQSIEGLAPGVYIVTVSDENGCEVIGSVYINEYICPVISLQSQQANMDCFGDCNGEIEILEVINGTPPYTYEWSNGENSHIATNLCAGDYTVIVTDALNCEIISETFTVTEPSELLLNATATDETANGANDGTATVSVTGGTSPYTYQWSTSETTQTIEELPPGAYTVTVNDNNACQMEASVYVEAFECTTLTTESYLENANCQGSCDGLIEMTQVSGGEPPYNFEWSNGGYGHLLTDLCAGSYEVTISDAVNCSVTADFIITEPEALVVLVSSTDETSFEANDGTATVTVSGGNSPYSYEWSSGETTSSINNLAPGNYMVTIADGNDCEIVDAVYIEAFECTLQMPEASLSFVNCYGNCDGQIELSPIPGGNPPYSFLWSTGQTGQQITGLCAGNFTVTLTDATNCSLTGSYTITQPDPMALNISSTDETAFEAKDGSATAEISGGTGPYTFIWNTGSAEPTLVDLSPGEYSVTVTDQNGCESIESILINAFGCNLFLDAVSTDATCFESCDGSVIVSDITNGNGPFTFNWSNGSTTQNISDLCAGVYQLTVTDASNCSIIQSFTIAQPDEIIIYVDQILNVSTSQAGSILITTKDTYIRDWTGPGGFKSTDEDISGLEAGCYHLVVTDPNSGCSKDTTICVEDLTSLAEQGSPVIHIFPNPVKELLTIDLHESGMDECEIGIVDLEGRRVKEIHKDASTDILFVDMSALKAGVYLVKFRSRDKYLFRKVVIIH